MPPNRLPTAEPRNSFGKDRKQAGDAMLVRIDNANDIAPGEMRVFDVEGTKVNVTRVGRELHAFDDTCTHRACSLRESWMGPL